MRQNKYARICSREASDPETFRPVFTDPLQGGGLDSFLSWFQIGNRVLYIFFTHVKELFGDVVLRPVVRPLRWSNMATMPALPETQENIKEEIRRQVGSVLSIVFFKSV